MQAMDQEQEEIRDARDRARDIADRDDLRLVAMPALPGGEKRHAAPGGVAAKRAADVEMAATLSLARLGIALAQAARDLPDQRAHLFDLSRVDARQRRVAQHLVAQILRFLAAIKRERLRDRVAHGLAQALSRGLQPLGQRRIALAERIEIVA